MTRSMPSAWTSSTRVQQPRQSKESHEDTETQRHSQCISPSHLLPHPLSVFSHLFAWSGSMLTAILLSLLVGGCTAGTNSDSTLSISIRRILPCFVGKEDERLGQN